MKAIENAEHIRGTLDFADRDAWDELIKVTRELNAACRAGFEMRRRQKDYFKTKDREILIDSKRLENAFDVRLATLGFR
jgi:hypothetical protein